MAMVRTNQTTAPPMEVRAATVSQEKTEAPEVTPAQVGKAEQGVTLDGILAVEESPETGAPGDWAAPTPEAMDPTAAPEGKAATGVLALNTVDPMAARVAAVVLVVQPQVVEIPEPEVRAG